MCKDCKASPMGVQRQQELDSALEACKVLNINPNIGGFIARHAWKGYTPQFKHDERVALDCYNAAQQAMKKLHEDYVFDGMRRYHEEMQEKGIRPQYIVHGDIRKGK